MSIPITFYALDPYVSILCIKISSLTTRKKLINDAIKASWKCYDDTSLKCHGLDFHYIYRAAMTLLIASSLDNVNNDTRIKSHL